MAFARAADPHAYDYESISCACGHALGYRPARSAEMLRCVACEREQVRPAAAPLPAGLYRHEAVLALCDAWDAGYTNGRMNVGRGLNPFQRKPGAEP